MESATTKNPRVPSPREDHRKKKTRLGSVKSPLCSDTVTCPFQKKKNKIKKNNAGKNRWWQSTHKTHICTFVYHRYLQFHHVCTATRGNSLPWLHPMAHKPFAPPPTGCSKSVRMRPLSSSYSSPMQGCADALFHFRRLELSRPDEFY